MLAREHQDIDHLARGLRVAVATGQGRPEFIEAARPRAAVAFLGERQRALQPARLALQQLEVVIKRRAGAESAVQPFVAGDLAALMADDDLAGADRGSDPQSA